VKLRTSSRPNANAFRAFALFWAISTAVLAGCTGLSSNSSRSAAKPPPLGENRSSQAHNGPRLYVLDCGSITFADVALFGLTNEETSVRELAVPCYLIDHPEGRLLWDTGLPASLAGSSEPQTIREGVSATYPRSLASQLDELGLKPADIDKIALSHMHFDHVGSANLFAQSQLLIQRDEYVAAFEQADQFKGVFDPALYEKLVDARRRVLNGDYDVFGDGSVRIIAAPGHTPGHQVLFVELENEGPTVLSGDLYHFQFNRTHQRVPSFNFDAELTRGAMVKVEALLEKEQAKLWLQHNKALFDSLRHSPAYYD